MEVQVILSRLKGMRSRQKSLVAGVVLLIIVVLFAWYNPGIRSRLYFQKKTIEANFKIHQAEKALKSQGVALMPEYSMTDDHGFTPPDKMPLVFQKFARSLMQPGYAKIKFKDGSIGELLYEQGRSAACPRWGQFPGLQSRVQRQFEGLTRYEYLSKEGMLIGDTQALAFGCQVRLLFKPR